MVELEVWMATFYEACRTGESMQLFWSKQSADRCIRSNYPGCSCVESDKRTIYTTPNGRIILKMRTLRAANAVSDVLPLPVAELAVMALQGDPIAIDAIQDVITR